ncbi:MAG: hypothetical protein HY909_23560 [Deltaproteobacteria bacterium]|nr:hypothetical protein [Deltaproteobacteria bacterium]
MRGLQCRVLALASLLGTRTLAQPRPGPCPEGSRRWAAVEPSPELELAAACAGAEPLAVVRVGARVLVVLPGPDGGRSRALGEGASRLGTAYGARDAVLAGWLDTDGNARVVRQELRAEGDPLVLGTPARNATRPPFAISLERDRALALVPFQRRRGLFTWAFVQGSPRLLRAELGDAVTATGDVWITAEPGPSPGSMALQARRLSLTAGRDPRPVAAPGAAIQLGEGPFEVAPTTGGPAALVQQVRGDARGEAQVATWLATPPLSVNLGVRPSTLGGASVVGGVVRVWYWDASGVLQTQRLVGLRPSAPTPVLLPTDGAVGASHGTAFVTCGGEEWFVALLTEPSGTFLRAAPAVCTQAPSD